MHPPDHSDKNDEADCVIWIASYPKSGNTWVQAVTRAAGRSFGFPTEDIDVYKMKAEGRSPVVVRGIREMVSTGKTAVLKTHAPIKEGVEPHRELDLRMAGFVYVMRNPLDVLLSYINFTRIAYESHQGDRQFQKTLFKDLLGFDAVIPYEQWRETPLEAIPRKNLDHALMRFTELDTVIPGLAVAGGSWLEHCQSWHRASKIFPSVMFRYEDLLKDSEDFLRLKKLFAFPEKKIINAANTVGGGLGTLQGKRIFFNKMRAYYYSKLFSANATQGFLDKFETELRQLGYGNLYKRQLRRKRPQTMPERSS